MPVYYPSVAVNLTMRFDEALLNGTTPAPKSPDDGAKAQSVGDGGATAKAGLLDGAKDRLTHVLAMVPRRGTVEIPTYRQAPKFNLTFAYRDFPIDPRAIRAMGVEIYIGTVSSANFKDGMRGVKSSATMRLVSQLVLKDENLRLAGLVNSLTVEHGQKGSEVVMEGMGLSGMMLAATVNAKLLASLNFNQSIDGLVKEILAKDAQSAKIPVRTSSDDWPNGLPNAAALSIISRNLKGSDGKKTQMPMQGDPNRNSVWDVITKYCFYVGAIPYFIAHELWIRPAKSIYEQKNAGYLNQPKTPFKDGRPRDIKTGGSTQSISFRKLVYGRNLETLKFERKFGPTTVPTIRCVSTDPSKKGKDSLIDAVCPEPGTPGARTTAVDPSGNASRTEIMLIPVPGITDKSRLKEIARQVYEEIGRGEVGGSASSKDLSSLGGDNEDADLIRVMPGDPVEFLVDAAGLQAIPPVVSELNERASQSVQKAVQAVNDRLGGDRQDLAQVLVGTARGSFNALQSVFRVNNVKYGWDVEKGIAVDFDFNNYIQARYDLSNKKGGQGEIGDFTSKQPSSSYGSSGSGAA